MSNRCGLPSRQHEIADVICEANFGNLKGASKSLINVTAMRLSATSLGWHQLIESQHSPNSTELPKVRSILPKVLEGKPQILLVRVAGNWCIER